MELAPALPPISLRSLNVVSSHIPHVQAAREQLVGEMEAMLVTGVQELVGEFYYDAEPSILTVALEQTTPVICAINCPQPSYSPGDGAKSCWGFDPGGGSESKRGFRYGGIGTREGS
jgi:hypothetical protein